MVSTSFTDKETKSVTKITTFVVFAYTTRQTYETKTTQCVVFVSILVVQKTITTNFVVFASSTNYTYTRKTTNLFSPPHKYK